MRFFSKESTKQSVYYYIQKKNFLKEKKNAWPKTQQELVFAAPPKKINQSIKQTHPLKDQKCRRYIRWI